MTGKKISILVLTVLTLFLASCHTESPNDDDKDIEVIISEIYNASGTLYDGTGTPPQSIPVTENDLNIKVSIKNGKDLYKLVLIAEDSDKYEIKSISDPGAEEIFTVSNADFAITQISDPQVFTLSIELHNNSEEIFTSDINLTAEVEKFYPFDRIYKDLGTVEEIEGEMTDFREKNGKLAFVQFMSKGCLSCYEEAREMKTMYADTLNYNLIKYSHSMFGTESFTESEFRDFKTRQEKLPFGCYWDEDNSFKSVFEDIVGKPIENEVFCVMPDGMINYYDYNTDIFEEWIHEMYNEAFPAK